MRTEALSQRTMRELRVRNLKVGVKKVREETFKSNKGNVFKSLSQVETLRMVRVTCLRVLGRQ